MKRTMMLLLLMGLFAVADAKISQPVLKWAEKGGGPYLMSGAYSGSPAVADLDHDGDMEIIWANYMVYVVDGNTGDVVWNCNTGDDRSHQKRKYVGWTWPAVAVADVDGDGYQEIITAHDHGHISVYRHDGYFYNSNWPQQRCPESDLRSLCVADLDNNGQMEVLVGSTRKGTTDHDWYLLDLNGRDMPGWPQSAVNHCGHGGYNEEFTVADIDGDSQLEILALSTVPYLNAYNPDGSHLITGDYFGKKRWADVPILYSPEAELAGHWPRSEWFPKFAYTAPVTADLNNDGELEIILIGAMTDITVSPMRTYYYTPVIFDKERRRFHTESYDWNTFPELQVVDADMPVDDYVRTRFCLPNTGIGDLGGDGEQEIIFPSYDGALHAVWLDKTEKHNWPFQLYQAAEGFLRYASEPAIVDIDNDGHAEIIIGSWTEKGSYQSGKLHILDYQGHLLHEVALPPTSKDWNGITSAPVIANIDDDADLEIVVGTAYSGLCAFDLPNSANARILWGTSRGNNQRTGEQATSADSGISSPTPALRPSTFAITCAPNPITPESRLLIDVRQRNNLTIRVFDVLGRQMGILSSLTVAPGQHTVSLAADWLPQLANGIYFMSVTAPNESASLKFSVMQ